MISVILKTIVVVCATTGVVMNVLGMGGSTGFLFFTIQSNIWIALVCLAGLVLDICKVRPSRIMGVIKMVFTASITLTGIVYCGMLAPFIGPGAFALSSSLVHVVVPIAAVADYFVCRTDYPLKKKDSVWVILPPIYYLGFAAVGFVLNWDFGGGANYPYYFLNWGSPAGAFGFVSDPLAIGVIYYVLFLLAFMIGVGALYVGVGYRKALAKATHNM